MLAMSVHASTWPPHVSGMPVYEGCEYAKWKYTFVSRLVLPSLLGISVSSSRHYHHAFSCYPIIIPCYNTAHFTWNSHQSPLVTQSNHYNPSSHQNTSQTQYG